MAGRETMLPWIEQAGLLILTADSSAEQIEATLVRLRELLPPMLDQLSRRTLRADVQRRLTAQGVRHVAGMLDAALAGPPRPAADRKGDRRVSRATALVDVVLEAGVELWHSPAGDPYITIPAAEHREHYPLKRLSVRDWIAHRYHTQTGTAVSSSVVSDVLSVLGGMARFDGDQHPVAVRVAERNGALYIDLGDPTWRAIEVSIAGWAIEPRPEVRFIRSRGMLPLAKPEPGGSIETLGGLLHVTDETDFRLLVGWLLGALHPRGPYPVLALVGEQGSGKSTAARVLRRLVDPHVAELRAEPRVIDDLMIAASRSRIVALDNVSHLPAWLSDGLCRLATGGALTKRELYSDAEEVIIEAMRPVLLTSITDVASRGDLLDRAIVVTLPMLPDRDRIPEAELWARYARLAPTILGTLLDAVAEALRRERNVDPPDLPRMADWARWVTGAEPAFGWEAGATLSAYHAMRGQAVEVSLDGDPLAAALRQFRLPWEGTMRDLLSRLTPEGRLPAGWPQSPRALSGALRRLAPGLRRVGITWTTHREAGTGGRRLVRLAHEEGNGPSPSSPSSHRQSLRADLGDGQGDGCDGQGDGRQPEPSPDSTPISGGCDGCDGGDGRSQALCVGDQGRTEFFGGEVGHARDYRDSRKD